MFEKMLSVTLLTAIAVHAGNGIAAEKRHAEAHVHGIAEINIVVEGKKITVEFRTPAESVMGFEHDAKTEAERKKRDGAMKIINDRFNELVVIDKSLGCKSQSAKALIVRDADHDAKGKTKGSERQKISGAHSEVQATRSFECDRSPAGSTVSFGVSKLFPEIHELKVQVLSDTKQSGVTIKKDRGEVRL